MAKQRKSKDRGKVLQEVLDRLDRIRRYTRPLFKREKGQPQLGFATAYMKKLHTFMEQCKKECRRMEARRTKIRKILEERTFRVPAAKELVEQKLYELEFTLGQAYAILDWIDNLFWFEAYIQCPAFFGAMREAQGMCTPIVCRDWSLVLIVEDASVLRESETPRTGIPTPKDEDGVEHILH